MCDKAYIAIENVEENSECNVAYFDNDMKIVRAHV